MKPETHIQAEDNKQRYIGEEGFEWPQRAEPDSSHPNYQMQLMFDDILMLRPEEAVKDVTITQLMEHLKDEVPFDIEFAHRTDKLLKYSQA